MFLQIYAINILRQKIIDNYKKNYYSEQYFFVYLSNFQQKNPSIIPNQQSFSPIEINLNSNNFLFRIFFQLAAYRRMIQYSFDRTSKIGPWDDKEHSKKVFKNLEYTLQNKCKPIDSEKTIPFPLLRRKNQKQLKKQTTTSFYDKLIKSEKCSTTFSHKQSVSNSKIVFPLKTSTLHLTDINCKMIRKKNIKALKRTNSCGQILTLYNNSLIKIKPLVKKAKWDCKENKSAADYRSSSLLACMSKINKIRNQGRNYLLRIRPIF